MGQKLELVDVFEWMEFVEFVELVVVESVESVESLEFGVVVVVVVVVLRLEQEGWKQKPKERRIGKVRLFGVVELVDFEVFVVVVQLEFVSFRYSFEEEMD